MGWRQTGNAVIVCSICTRNNELLLVLYSRASQRALLISAQHAMSQIRAENIEKNVWTLCYLCQSYYIQSKMRSQNQ